MRVPLVVAVVETLVLVALAFAQFEAAVALGRNAGAGPAFDPLADPLVSDLGRIAVLLWLGAPVLIGVLVARARGRALHAAGLAFGAVASAVVASALLEQVAASGLALPDAGAGPRGVFIFVPPNGSTPNSSYLPLLVPLAIVVGGGLAAVEALVATWITRRLHHPTTGVSLR